MSDISPYFSSTYAAARAKYLKAVASAGLASRSFIQAEKGLEGEDLAIDLAYSGSPDAQRLLVLSCGTQGADGFAGSAIQSYLLHDAQWHEQLQASGIAVLYVHAVNPWGMSHLTFGDADNINFVRNFVDFSQPLPANLGYEQLHERALTPAWEVGTESEAATQEIIKKHGLNFLLNIHQRGQYTRPTGFYYGGTAPSWSHQQWRKILQTYGQKAQYVAWLDMRRGWGISQGQATLVANANPSDEDAIDRARDWWASGDNMALVARPDALQTLIPFGTGNPVISFAQECPQAQYTGLAAYFAVIESMQELSFAARSAQWLQAQNQPSVQDSNRTHAMMRAVSFKADSSWQEPVIAQGRQIAFQALTGLARSK